MADFYEFNYKGKKILCLDIADLQISDKPELYKLIANAKHTISQSPLKSVLIITNVKDTRFDTEIANLIKEYTNDNTPYIKSSCVVGISGWQKVIFTAIKTVTGRHFHLADTMDEAKEWLVNQ
jgi:hypothetical protein